MSRHIIKILYFIHFSTDDIIDEHYKLLIGKKEEKEQFGTNSPSLLLTPFRYLISKIKTTSCL